MQMMLAFKMNDTWFINDVCLYEKRQNVIVTVFLNKRGYQLQLNTRQGYRPNRFSRYSYLNIY